MAELAGVSVVVKVSGTALDLTAQATAEVIADTSYQITTASKRVIDWSQAVTVLDGGVETTEEYTINYLNGTVTFTEAAERVITITGHYLPTSVAAYATDSSSEAACDTIEHVVYGQTFKKRLPLFKYASGTLVNFDVTDDIYIPILNSNLPVVLEWVAAPGIEPDRYLAFLTNVSDALPAGGMEQRTIGWVSTDQFIQLGV